MRIPKSWTQVIYKYKNKFYNPVLQNRGHIYALKYLLKEYGNLDFISIVVFSNKATLKTKTSTHVIYLNKLLKTISQYNEIRISQKVKQEIVSKIYSNNLSIKANRKIQSPKDILQINFPRCSGVLIERNGKYGSFYGCSNYHACNSKKLIYSFCRALRKTVIIELSLLIIFVITKIIKLNYNAEINQTKANRISKK